MTPDFVPATDGLDYYTGPEPADVPVHRRSELLASGLTDVFISQQLTRGLLTRIRHGVYADTQALAAADHAGRHLAHLRAALIATTEPALATGPSAALLHGMPISSRSLDDLHILRISDQDPRSLRRPSQHRLELPSTIITTHRNAQLDSVTIRGMPVVSRSVAAITSAHLASFSRRVALFDSVLWSPSVSAADLAELARAWKHLGGLDDILNALEHARRGAQSYLETLSRLALLREGLPEPQLQVPFHDRHGLIGIADMYWPYLNVVGEADGAIKYINQDAIVNEKRRENRLRAAGLGVVRWMMSDILERPAEVADQVRREARRAA